jgi:hypothetical protein
MWSARWALENDEKPYLCVRADCDRFLYVGVHVVAPCSSSSFVLIGGRWRGVRGKREGL